MLPSVPYFRIATAASGWEEMMGSTGSMGISSIVFPASRRLVRSPKQTMVTCGSADQAQSFAGARAWSPGSGLSHQPYFKYFRTGRVLFGQLPPPTSKNGGFTAFMTENSSRRMPTWSTWPKTGAVAYGLRA